MPRPTNQRDFIVTCTHEVYITVKARTPDEAGSKALRQERAHFHNLTVTEVEAA